MRKLIMLLDTNILVNLYFVHEDIPEILDFLDVLKTKTKISLVTTNVILNEITNQKQKEFFFNRVSKLVDVICLSRSDVKEFSRCEGLHNMGSGELSVLYYLKNIKNNHEFNKCFFIFLTSDKKDILKKMERLKVELSFPPNVEFIHGLFLYYMMFYEDIYDENTLQDILYSSNRDFRISLADRKEYEKYFREFYQRIRSMFF